MSMYHDKKGRHRGDAELPSVNHDTIRFSRGAPDQPTPTTYPCHNLVRGCTGTHPASSSFHTFCLHPPLEPTPPFGPLRTAPAMPFARQDTVPDIPGSRGEGITLELPTLAWVSFDILKSATILSSITRAYQPPDMRLHSLPPLRVPFESSFLPRSGPWASIHQGLRGLELRFGGHPPPNPNCGKPCSRQSSSPAQTWVYSRTFSGRETRSRPMTTSNTYLLEQHDSPATFVATLV